MRIDKFLKISRVIKRRTIATEACSKGRVSINDRVAKASSEVKVGDIVEIKFGDKNLKFKIIEICETIKAEDTQRMIEVLN